MLRPEGALPACTHLSYPKRTCDPTTNLSCSLQSVHGDESGVGFDARNERVSRRKHLGFMQSLGLRKASGYGPSDGVRTDEWAFVGTDGRSYGVLPKAMVIALWKKKKLLAQTLVHHASEEVKKGQQLHRFHKQWKGLVSSLLTLNMIVACQYAACIATCTCMLHEVLAAMLCSLQMIATQLTVPIHVHHWHCMMSAESGELPSRLAMKELDVKTAYTQLRVLDRQNT